MSEILLITNDAENISDMVAFISLEEDKCMDSQLEEVVG